MCDNIEHGNHEYEGWENKQNIENTYRERNDPQETPCTLPQDKQEEHYVIANAHNECTRIQRILKSQRQRGIKYSEYRQDVPSG